MSEGSKSLNRGFNREMFYTRNSLSVLRRVSTHLHAFVRNERCAIYIIRQKHIGHEVEELSALIRRFVDAVRDSSTHYAIVRRTWETSRSFVTGCNVDNDDNVVFARGFVYFIHTLRSWLESLFAREKGTEPSGCTSL